MKEIIANFLLKENFLLTALEFNQELSENGQNCETLKKFFENEDFVYLKPEEGQKTTNSNGTGTISSLDHMEEQLKKKEDTISILDYKNQVFQQQVEELQKQLADQVKFSPATTSEHPGQQNSDPSTQNSSEGNISNPNPSSQNSKEKNIIDFFLFLQKKYEDEHSATSAPKKALSLSPQDKQFMNNLIKKYLENNDYKMTSMAFVDELDSSGEHFDSVLKKIETQKAEGCQDQGVIFWSTIQKNGLNFLYEFYQNFFFRFGGSDFKEIFFAESSSGQEKSKLQKSFFEKIHKEETDRKQLEDKLNGSTVALAAKTQQVETLTKQVEQFTKQIRQNQDELEVLRQKEKESVTISQGLVNNISDLELRLKEKEKFLANFMKDLEDKDGPKEKDRLRLVEREKELSAQVETLNKKVNEQATETKELKRKREQDDVIRKSDTKEIENLMHSLEKKGEKEKELTKEIDGLKQKLAEQTHELHELRRKNDNQSKDNEKKASEKEKDLIVQIEGLNAKITELTNALEELKKKKEAEDQATKAEFEKKAEVEKELQAEIEKKSQKEKELVSEVESIHKINKELENEIEELRKKQEKDEQTKKAEIEMLEKEIELKVQENDTKSQDIQKKNSEIEKQTKKIEEKIKELEKRTQKEKELQTDIESLKQNISDLTNEMAALQKKKDSEIQAAKSEIEKQAKQIENDAKHIELTAKELEKKNQEIEKQSKEIEKKTQESEKKIQEIEKKTQELEVKNQEIEKKNQQIQNQARDVEKQAGDISKQAKELEKKNETISQKSQEIESKVQEIAKKSAEISKQNETIEKKSQECEERSQEIEKKNSEIEKQSKEIAEKCKELQNLTKELEQKALDLEKRIENENELSSQIEKLKQRVTELKNELQELKTKKEEEKKTEEANDQSKQVETGNDTKLKEEIEAKSQEIQQKNQKIEEQADQIEKHVHEISKQAKEIERQTKQFEKQTKELEKQQKENEEKSQDIKKKTQDIEKQTKEIEKKTQENEKKTQDVEKKSKELEHLWQAVKKQKLELESKTEQLEKKNSELEEKKQEVAAQAKQLEVKSTEVEAKTQEISKKNLEIEKKVQEIEKLRQEIEEKSSTIKNNAEEIANQTKEIEQMKKELETRKQESENKSKELEKQKIELENQTKEISRQAKEIEQKIQEISAQTKEIEHKSKEIEKLSHNLEKIVEESDKKTQNIEKQAQDIQKQAKQIETQAKEVQNQQKQLEKASQENIAKTQQLEKASQENIAKTQQIEKQEKEIETKSAKEKELNTNIEKLQKKIQELNNDIFDMKNKKEKLEEERKALETKQIELQKSIEKEKSEFANKEKDLVSSIQSMEQKLGHRSSEIEEMKKKKQEVEDNLKHKIKEAENHEKTLKSQIQALELEKSQVQKQHQEILQVQPAPLIIKEHEPTKTEEAMPKPEVCVSHSSLAQDSLKEISQLLSERLMRLLETTKMTKPSRVFFDAKDFEQQTRDLLKKHKKEIKGLVTPLLVSLSIHMPENGARELVNVALLSMFKKPSKEQREFVVKAFVELFKKLIELENKKNKETCSVQEELEEKETQFKANSFEELLPALYKTSGLQFAEKKLLVIEILIELCEENFIPGEKRFTAIFPLFAKIINEENSSDDVRVGVVSATARMIVSCFDSKYPKLNMKNQMFVKEKYTALEDLLFKCMADPSQAVVDVAFKEFLPSLLNWCSFSAIPETKLNMDEENKQALAVDNEVMKSLLPKIFELIEMHIKRANSLWRNYLDAIQNYENELSGNNAGPASPNAKGAKQAGGKKNEKAKEKELEQRKKFCIQELSDLSKQTEESLAFILKFTQAIRQTMPSLYEISILRCPPLEFLEKYPISVDISQKNARSSEIMSKIEQMMTKSPENAMIWPSFNWCVLDFPLFCLNLLLLSTTIEFEFRKNNSENWFKPRDTASASSDAKEKEKQNFFPELELEQEKIENMRYDVYEKTQFILMDYTKTFGKFFINELLEPVFYVFLNNGKLSKTAMLPIAKRLLDKFDSNYLQKFISVFEESSSGASKEGKKTKHEADNLANCAHLIKEHESFMKGAFLTPYMFCLQTQATNSIEDFILFMTNLIIYVGIQQEGWGNNHIALLCVCIQRLVSFISKYTLLGQTSSNSAEETLKQQHIQDGIMRAVQSQVIHPDKRVKLTIIEILISLVDYLPPNKITSALLPCMITLSTDPEKIVKFGAIRGLGVLCCSIEDSKDNNLDKICFQFDVFLNETPFFSLPTQGDLPQHFKYAPEEGNAIALEVLKIFKKIIQCGCDENFRKNYITKKLLEMSKKNNVNPNNQDRKIFAFLILDVLRVTAQAQWPVIKPEEMKNVITPALDCLEVDASAMNEGAISKSVKEVANMLKNSTTTKKPSNLQNTLRKNLFKFI